MKKRTLINLMVSLALALSLSIYLGSDDSTPEEVVGVDTKNVTKLLLNVEGMTCEGCESAIQNSLSKVSGVTTAKASHVDKTTTIEYDKTKTDAAALEKVIVETGYKIIRNKEEISKAAPSAMKCAAGKCGAGKCGQSK